MISCLPGFFYILSKLFCFLQIDSSYTSVSSYIHSANSFGERDVSGGDCYFRLPSNCLCLLL